MERRGVSPVVGTILLLAITVILVAVIAAIVVPGLMTRSTPPVANIRIVKIDQGGIVLAHDGGDELVAKKTVIRIGVNGDVTEEMLSAIPSVGDTFAVGNQAIITGVNYSNGDEVEVTIIDRASKMKIFEGSAYVTEDSDNGPAVLSKKRPITIYGSSSNLTDYQVKVVVNYDSDMQPDFDDLRFKDNDEFTVLSYWVENYNVGENAIVWVRVPYIPASDNHIIWMFYGSPSATSESNGNATFVFFDDFNRANKADITAENTYSKTQGGTWSIENNMLKNVGASGDPNKLLFKSLGTVNYPVIMKTKIKVTTFGGGDLSRMGLSCCMSSNGEGYCALLHQAINRLDFLNDLQSWGTSFSSTWSLNTWYYLEFLVIDPSSRSGKTRLWEVGGSVPSWLDGNFGGGGARNWGYIGLGGSRQADVTYFDDVYVRKYANPEPSVSVGNETLA